MEIQPVDGLPLGQTSVLDLPDDALTRVFSILSCLDLARACCVCRSWRCLASSEALWLPLLKTELGLSRKPSWASSSCILFRKLVVDPLCVALANEARFAFLAGNIKGWLLRLRRHTKTALSKTVEEMYVSPDRVTVNRQSLWIQFVLPDRAHDIAEQPQEHKQWDVSLDALYGDSARDRMSYHELTVIDAPGYKWPHSDYHMLMQSHVDGLYAWDEGDGTLKVVAYVHYQHLLPLADGKISTPQALKLPRKKRTTCQTSSSSGGAAAAQPSTAAAEAALPSRLMLHCDLSQLGGPRARESCLVNLALPPPPQCFSTPEGPIYSRVQREERDRGEEYVTWAACPTWQPDPDQQQAETASSSSSRHGLHATSSPSPAGALPAVCMLPSAEEQQDYVPGTQLADALVQLSSAAAEWRVAAHEAVQRAGGLLGDACFNALHLLQMDLAANGCAVPAGSQGPAAAQAGGTGKRAGELSVAVQAAEAAVGCEGLLDRLGLDPDPLEHLDQVLSREGMMDFALYASDTGQLLLGRCGVETWSHDMPVRIPDKEGRTNMLCPLLNTRSHNMHFLVDGVDQSLWSNQLSLGIVSSRVPLLARAQPAWDPQQSGLLPAFRPQPLPQRLQAMEVPGYMEGWRLRMSRASAAAMVQQAAHLG